MNTPNNLKYSKDHEWVKVDGNVATVGITDFAQSQLGDIVFVDIQTEGEDLEAGELFGNIEAVNSDPYGKGWMVKVEMSNPAEVDGLLDADAYAAICK